MLTGPPCNLPQTPITWDAREGWMHIYCDVQYHFTQSLLSVLSVYTTMAFHIAHKWLKSAGWVFSAWKEGCVIYRWLWQKCPEWVLSLGTATVNSSDTPWNPHNYTVLIPICHILTAPTAALHVLSQLITEPLWIRCTLPSLPASHFRVMIALCFSQLTYCIAAANCNALQVGALRVKEKALSWVMKDFSNSFPPQLNWSA